MRYRTLSLYPVVDSDGGVLYPTASSLAGVKLSLMPWESVAVPVVQETEEEHRARQAEEYVRRFGNKAKDKNG